MTLNKPADKPSNPNFSSGPCAKRPEWNISLLKNSIVGRSHRSKEAKSKLKLVIDKSKIALEIVKKKRPTIGKKGKIIIVKIILNTKYVQPSLCILK